MACSPIWPGLPGAYAPVPVPGWKNRFVKRPCHPQGKHPAHPIKLGLGDLLLPGLSGNVSFRYQARQDDLHLLFGGPLTLRHGCFPPFLSAPILPCRLSGLLWGQHKSFARGLSLFLNSPDDALYIKAKFWGDDKGMDVQRQERACN
jgi:hypothetical protein